MAQLSKPLASAEDLGRLQRPLVLPATSPVKVRLASDSEMFVTLDGSRGRSLALGQEMVVTLAPHRTMIPFALARGRIGPSTFGM